MRSLIQLNSLHPYIDEFQAVNGGLGLKAIYGAGCTSKPKILFIFMNPTAKNVSAHPEWDGLRAPWLGTKVVWNIFKQLGLLSAQRFAMIQEMRPGQWTPEFSEELYGEIAKQKTYITNLAKCTQADARPLSNRVFREYRELALEEIQMIKPKRIVAFGNQVSSILLDRPISVSNYTGPEKEVLAIKKYFFDVYPVYYPVGQGRRNMPLAIKRISKII
jgi:uracil-DNA glycosylase